jgi:hypothetical protein
MSLDEAALIELMDLARRRGGLAVEDLRAALPIDSMTIDEISHVLARLDEAGFDLEIDPALLLPERGMTPKGETPIATTLSQTAPVTREQRTELSSFGGRANSETRAGRRSDPTASAPMLPWILAFAIVVFAVFGAFAY